jgi:hypothetical protein
MNMRLDRNWEIPEVEKPTFVRRTRRRRRDRKGRPRVRPDPGDNPASRDRKGRRISTPCRERSTPWRKRGCKRTQDIRSCWRCEPAPTGATRFLARCRCRNWGPKSWRTGCWPGTNRSASKWWMRCKGSVRMGLRSVRRRRRVLSSPKGCWDNPSLWVEGDRIGGRVMCGPVSLCCRECSIVVLMHGFL